MRDPGAPLELYLLLRPAGEPELIDREVPPGAEILDLGSGPGRVTNALVELGRRVVAVDFDERMLEHVRGAETVHARIEDLDLPRTFGGVLLMSNLVNTPDDAQRAALLATCRRHVAPDGVVLVQHYGPDAGVDATPYDREAYGIRIRARDIRRDGKRLSMTVEQDAGERGRWAVRIENARVLDDDDMRAALAAAGLRLERFVDERHTWVVATPR